MTAPAGIESGGTGAAASPQAVLDFWFGTEQAVDPRWFNGGAEFDALIRRQHGATLAAALRGDLAHWAAPDAPAGHALALIVVLDQFTRNVHRGTPQAFAGDAQALELARQLVASGAHLQLGPLQRWFAYMPFEHAEEMEAQDEALRLFTALHAEGAGTPLAEALAGALDYAERHALVVRRFGRFPHRNAILGRASSAEELAFLQQPGSSF